MPSSGSGVFRSGSSLCPYLSILTSIPFVCLTHSLKPPPPQKFTIWLPTIIIFLQTNEQYPTWLFLPTPSLSTTKRTADSRLGCTIHGYKHLRRRSHPRGQHVLPAPSDVIIPPSAHPIPSRKAGSVGRVGATWWASEQEWVDMEFARIRESIGIWVANRWGWECTYVAVCKWEWGSEKRIEISLHSPALSQMARWQITSCDSTKYVITTSSVIGMWQRLRN